MSGIYIGGLEMPKNCALCRLERDIFGRAVCFGVEDGRALCKDDLPPVGSAERRPEWCTLVDVPDSEQLIDIEMVVYALSNIKWRVAKLSDVLKVLQKHENDILIKTDGADNV